METGPAPPAPDCKFLQAAARQPGEGAAAPGRAGGAAAAPRPHLKEKKGTKKEVAEEEGEEEENEKEQGEEEKEEEEEKGEEKETEPERRRKRERKKERQKGRVSGSAFPLPFLRSLAPALRALRLQLSPGEAGNWVGLYRAAPPLPLAEPGLERAGVPLRQQRRAPPASSRSPPRSPRRGAGRRRQHRELPVQGAVVRAPRPQPPARPRRGAPSPPPFGARGPGPFPPSRGCETGPGRPAAGSSSHGLGARAWALPDRPAGPRPCRPAQQSRAR